MYITDDGIRLNAKLEFPAGHPDKCPLVIVFHGFTGHMEEDHIVGVSRVFNELGAATLRVELYGHGASDGLFKDHTLFKWMSNALAVVDFARKLEFVTDIYLCGHSQGGLLVMLTAAMEADHIKGLIPLSPAWMIPEGARKGNLLGISFDPDHIPDELDGWDDERTLGGSYIRAAQMIYVEPAIERYEGPVLIVHGDYAYAFDIERMKDINCTYSKVRYFYRKDQIDHHIGYSIHLEDSKMIESSLITYELLDDVLKRHPELKTIRERTKVPEISFEEYKQKIDDYLRTKNGYTKEEINDVFEMYRKLLPKFYLMDFTIPAVAAMIYNEL